MDELISRQALLDSLEEPYNWCDTPEELQEVTDYKRFVSLILETPTIDATPVVRCKECENWGIDWEPERGNKGDHWCSMIDLVVPPDFFCKHGERRCENETD